ncbi:MAG TPA: ATP-binding protein [Candidatus Acidoferrales bacterium]|jgi:PAS domain S-box-containing protein|nr:ATP-binding protein [Candidatus Acidoferrales bacterium]
MSAILNESKPADAAETAPAPSRPAGKPRGAEQELFWQNRELTAFHRISEVMLSDGSEQSVFDTIARETSGMTDFPMVSIELCDFNRAVMIYRGAHGIPLHEMPSPFEVPMDVTLSGQVAHTGETLVEYNVAGRREYAAPILRILGVQTFVCVPIKSDGKIIGTLSLAHHEQIEVEPRVVKAATGLANYLATQFDRLLAREAARRSEAELSIVYDRVPNVLCLFDEDLQIVRANHAAIEFASLGKEISSPLRLGEFFRCKNHSTETGTGCGQPASCLGCNLRRVLMETLTTGKSMKQVRMTKTLTRNGQPAQVVLLVSTERIQFHSTVRVLMCLEDITKNVRADEQIRSQAALLDITQDAIFVRDFSDRVIYWNAGAQRLYGWTPAEAQRSTSTELLANSDPSETTRALQAVMHAGEWTGEMKQKSRDGRDLIIQSRWTLMRERDGRPKAILIVNADVTEKKQLESQLLRGQRLESIGTLASGLAHDLNNVLAPIMMAVQFIKDNAEDEGMKACFQTLETCSRRGADIIRQVLMFARGVEGQRILINPKHLIQEMQRIARETFPRSIEVNTTIAKQTCILLGDATQIQQVIMNLCVNARDAMPNGGTLTIGLSRTELDATGAKIHPKAKPGSYVVISVSDTGTGIPTELLDKIFDPFFTTKPLGQGTGLGLPTVLGITENHGGFVHLQSQPGCGTTFRIHIPAAPGENESGERNNQPGENVKGNDELILVVDDEPAVRRLASAILNRNGYRTLTAAEGREGAAMFAKHRNEIRLVVSDVMMPQMDGPAMLRELKLIQPGVKSIVITGLGEENRIAEAKAAGADVVMQKPFTADELLKDVRLLLSQAPVAS